MAELTGQITGGGRKLRTCSTCGKPDIRTQEWFDGQLQTQHTVRMEVRYLDTMEGMQRLDDRKDPVKMLRLERKGWKFITFQGRPAIERYSCVDCLNAHDRARGIWAELREHAERLERKPDPDQNYYHVLCEVDD